MLLTAYSGRLREKSWKSSSAFSWRRAEYTIRTLAFFRANTPLRENHYMVVPVSLISIYRLFLVLLSKNLLSSARMHVCCMQVCCEILVSIQLMVWLSQWKRYSVSATVNYKCDSTTPFGDLLEFVLALGVSGLHVHAHQSSQSKLQSD